MSMLNYILQMMACSGVLYAYYHFFLRNGRFHQYNRFYLLLCMVLSLVLPLIKIPVLPPPSNNASSIVYAFAGTGETVMISNSSSGGYEKLLYIAYLVPVLLLLARFVLSIRQIIRLKAASVSEKTENITLIYTDHPNAPFSFFNWLFWNNHNDPKSPEGNHIWQHEIYHIRSKHSWDLVFVELVLAICWLNPLFYLYRKEIKTIHEFLADQHATHNCDATQYAEQLVWNAMGIRHHHLIHPFFQHQIKRRIAMLTSPPKSAASWLRKLSAVPLLLTTAAAVIISCNTADKEADTPASTSQTAAPDPVTQQPAVDSSASTSAVQQAPTDIPREPEVFAKVEVDAKYPGNWRKFLEQNLNGQVAADNGAPPGAHTTIIQFIVDVKGNVSDVKALTKVGYGLEAEAIRVIQQSGKWLPAIMHGKPVKAYRKQPITFMLTEA